MPISKRTLTKWRKEGLKNKLVNHAPVQQYSDELNNRILLLTQELMDQHLLKEK